MGCRSAVAEEMSLEEAKIEATWDITDPIFTPRERTALEMCTVFTEGYRAVTDDHMARWRQEFTDEEIVELGLLMAFAEGSGRLVLMLGLDAADQKSPYEI
jgi:alkylhydroperoxidase family enzyme